MLQIIIDFIKELLGIKEEHYERKYQEPQKEFKESIEDFLPKQEPLEPQNQKTYRTKKLLTYTEIQFKEAIEKFLPNHYILYPQINLASIIKRTDEHTYQNELYRNVDFCIFDRNYNPIVIIEINDNTHKEKQRQARDIKVQQICQSAGISIIKFWTDYGVNEKYIKEQIEKYCK